MNTLSPDLLRKMNAYWRVANSLFHRPSYLYDNPAQIRGKSAVNPPSAAARYVGALTTRRPSPAAYSAASAG